MALHVAGMALALIGGKPRTVIGSRKSEVRPPSTREGNRGRGEPFFFIFSFYLPYFIVFYPFPLPRFAVQLAMIQTNGVLAELRALFPGRVFDVQTMETLGDKVLDVALSKVRQRNVRARVQCTWPHSVTGWLCYILWAHPYVQGQPVARSSPY